jgi:hypothetical protein
MHFEIFLGWQMMMFPLHTLAFTLWLVMVDPYFISCDDSFQKVVIFSTITIQKPFADIQTFLFVQFCELLFDPL